MQVHLLYRCLLGLLVVALCGGLLAGAYEVSWMQLLGGATDTESYVLWHIRLPRLLLAALVGAGLSVVGASLQGMFRNPLAEPGLIGISSGAMLFAACAFVLAPSLLPATTPAWIGHGIAAVAAFSGGLVATFLVYRMGIRSGRIHVSIMLLAGIALASLAAALTGYLIFLSDDGQLRDLTFWTLGSLSGASWWQVVVLLPVVVAGTVLVQREARTLNALGLGEREAQLLGLDVERCKRIVALCGALMVGVSIAFTGIIGFVGLVIPHLLRLLIGGDFRQLIPAAALLGAGFLMLTDTLARITVAPAELPIGILTALIGAPFFIWLLLRRRQTFTV